MGARKEKSMKMHLGRAIVIQNERVHNARLHYAGSVDRYIANNTSESQQSVDVAYAEKFRAEQKFQDLIDKIPNIEVDI